MRNKHVFQFAEVEIVFQRMHISICIEVDKQRIVDEKLRTSADEFPLLFASLDASRA